MAGTRRWRCRTAEHPDTALEPGRPVATGRERPAIPWPVAQPLTNEPGAFVKDLIADPDSPELDAHGPYDEPTASAVVERLRAELDSYDMAEVAVALARMQSEVAVALARMQSDQP